MSFSAVLVVLMEHVVEILILWIDVLVNEARPDRLGRRCNERVKWFKRLHEARNNSPVRFQLNPWLPKRGVQGVPHFNQKPSFAASENKTLAEAGLYLDNVCTACLMVALGCFKNVGDSQRNDDSTSINCLVELNVGNVRRARTHRPSSHTGEFDPLVLVEEQRFHLMMPNVVLVWFRIRCQLPCDAP